MKTYLLSVNFPHDSPIPKVINLQKKFILAPRFGGFIPGSVFLTALGLVVRKHIMAGNTLSPRNKRDKVQQAGAP